MIEIQLGDLLVNLDDIAAGLVCTALDVGWPDVRVVTAGRPLVDGAIDTTSRFGARPVSASVAVLDTPDHPWKAVLASLGPFLAASARPTMTLNFDGVDYRIGLAPDMAAAPFETPNHARAQLNFRAPDPFFYGPVQTATSGSFRAGTSGRTYPWTPPRVYPTSDAISGEFTATNGGDVLAWPTVNIWGPLATSFTIANLTTGETFKVGTVNIDTGHRLEINMLNRTVRVDGDPAASRFSAVDFTTSRWVHLDPGGNLLRFATGATSDALCSVEWADPHLWPGGLTP